MDINKTANLLKKHEGLKLTPYRCTAGKLTIGYGRNLEDNGITKEEAEQLLFNDISELHEILTIELGYELYGKLNDDRRSVLINMAFNLGLSGLMKFRRMLEAIRINDFNLAAKEMLNSRWSEQVGNRSIELAQMMKSGGVENS